MGLGYDFTNPLAEARGSFGHKNPTGLERRLEVVSLTMCALYSTQEVSQMCITFRGIGRCR